MIEKTHEMHIVPELEMLPWSHTSDASHVADIFLKQIVWLHGVLLGSLIVMSI